MSDADEPASASDEPAEELADDVDAPVLRYTPTKHIDRRIDQYLTDRINYLSRNGVQKLIDEGLVTVNGKPTKSSYRPRNGDVIEMAAPPEPVNEIVPEPIPLDIVYEDDHLLALNKQANLVIHPARGVWTGTLVNGLIYYGQKWSTLNGEWRPGILHRLDRNTTGIMLVAKSDEAHWRVARQFENRTIQKTYVAVAHGVPELLSDMIDLPIGRDRYVRERQAIRKIENGGKPAVTRYEVLETFDAQVASQKATDGIATARTAVRDAADGLTSSAALPTHAISLIPSPFANDRHYAAPPERFSFVRLTPKTGRTHQLRVHLSHIGFPIVGDTMYGGRTVDSGDFRFARQALHAAQIAFTHPVSLQPMTLTAPLPPDIVELISRLRGEKSPIRPAGGNV